MAGKNIKKVNSPEQLNQYIKLTNPGVWIILIAIIILLFGICIWGIFGRIDTKISSVVISDNNGTYCYIKEDDFVKVKSGMEIEVGDNVALINYIDNTPIKIDDNFSEYALKIGNLKKDDWVYKCKLSDILPKGIYDGKITVESINPSKFITN